MQSTIKDLLRFKKELYFNGAVQVDWFYREDKRKDIAKSYVFHGPEYFGVSEEDIIYKAHRLVDTITFTNALHSKLYGENYGSNFMLTIAPYGTGKSHLAVTLASLFSKNDEIKAKVIENILKVDNKSQLLVQKEEKPNLILILNGMRDFNLNYEILNVTINALKSDGIDPEFLKSLTKSYEIAENFLRNTYDLYVEKYERVAKEKINSSKTNLKDYLLDNLLKDPIVFEVINSVYQEINGTFIRWDEGLSAGDVLLKVSESLCGERKPYNKILILFDEFGRYIEFASSYATRAGDSALQQIYEAIQNSEDKIIFVGFIQSDLKTYLTRVDRAANINRYIGRYESSEKIHLSSNLETIFANLIERKDTTAFNSLISKKLDNIQWKTLHTKMLQWLPSMKDTSVWGKYEHFKKVILEGVFPLHPLTTWMLSNLSSWLQQRSSITFLDSQINEVGNVSINEFGNLPFIPAINIIQSDFFQEFLAAEKDGRKQSEYCTQYNDILIRFGDKFNDRQKSVLAANLVLRLCKFRTLSQPDVKDAIASVSMLSLPEVEMAINSLVDDYGVLSFDEVANVYDFVSDAIGVNDFKRLLNTKRRKIDLSLVMYEEMVNEFLNLEPIETGFARENYITTKEWDFPQQFIKIDDLSKDYLSSLKKDFLISTTPDKSKGKVFWVYVPQNYPQELLNSVVDSIKNLNIDDIPYVFFILDDKEGLFFDTVLDYHVLLTLTDEDKMKFARFIPTHKQKIETLLRNRFDELAKDRLMMQGKGIGKIDGRVSKYLSSLLQNLYPKVIPFPFTEFNKSNKSLSVAKKNLSRISRLILSEANIYQIIQAENTDIRNRIEGLLFEKRQGSWGVFNSNYQLISPLNLKVREIFGLLDDKLIQCEHLHLRKVFDLLQRPPFGINDYALSLLLAVYFAQRKNEIRLKIIDQQYKFEEWAKLIFKDKNIDFENFLNTHVFKIDADAVTGRFLNLFTKVERNTDVEILFSLNQELQNLLLEEAIPETLNDKLTNAQIILQMATTYYNRIENQLGDAKEKYLKGKKEKDFKDLVEVINFCYTINGYVDELNRYSYSETQVKLAEDLIKNSKEVILKEFVPWVGTLSCPNISQVTGFEKWGYRLSNSLRELGFSNEAQLLRSRIDKVTSDLKVLQRINNIDNNVKTYLSKSFIPTIKDYNQLFSLIKEGKELVDFITGIKVDKSFVSDYLDNVEKRLNQLTDYRDSLKEDISNIYNRYFDLETIEDGKELLSETKELLKKPLSSVDKQGIEKAANDLQNFMNDIEGLRRYNEDYEGFNLELESIKNKWDQFEKDFDTDVICDKIKERYYEEFIRLEKNWVQRYIKNNKVENWDANQCTSWIESTMVLPNYLSDETKNEYKEINGKVYQRLNLLAIEGVVSLFKKLTDEQKVICAKIIQNELVKQS